MKILIFYWNTDFSLTEDDKISLSFMEKVYLSSKTLLAEIKSYQLYINYLSY